MSDYAEKEKAFIERWDSKSKAIAQRAHDLCTDPVTQQEIGAFIRAVEHDLADNRVLGLMGFNALMKVEGVLNDPSFYHDVYRDADTEEVRALKALGQEARELWRILREKYESERHWIRKIEAFLYRLPWEAVCEKELPDDEREKVLKGLTGGGELVLARQANDAASGLDVPAFARIEEWSVFAKNSILIHPLSGRRFPLEKTPECTATREAIMCFLNSLKEEYKNDDRKKFLVLWRLLPVLKGVGSVGELLPADPHVPDHSIWDHAATASAFACTWDGQKFNPALLIFTIASAQDFLAAARRTQDLWGGSFLFSYLIWRAMEPVVENLGPDVVLYPSLPGQPLVDRWLLGLGLDTPELRRNAQDIERLKIANFPNLFTAIVPYQQAEKLAEEVVDKLNKAKKDIFDSVKKFVEEALKSEKDLVSAVAKARIQDEKNCGIFISNVENVANDDKTWNKLWKDQMNSFLHFNVFWVVHPWAAPNGSSQLNDLETYHKTLVGERVELASLYQKIREVDSSAEGNLGLAYPLISELAGRMLTARKNLRHFAQAPQSGHKCSQCGIREALHPSFAGKEGDTYPELAAFWEILQRVGEKDGQYKLAGRIRRGDRLCAVCLTKRLAWEAFFLEKDRSEGGFRDVKENIDRAGRLPAHILFPSTATIATAKFKERVLQKLCEPNVQDVLWNVLKNYVAEVKTAIEPHFYPAAELPRLEKLAQEAKANFSDSSTDSILNDFLRLDGEWLYPESFEPEAFAQEFAVALTPDGRKKLENARQALEELLATAERLGIPKPQRYFALLAMDGDRMGEWVTGRRGPTLREILHPDVAEALHDDKVLQKPRPLGPAHHRALSAALKNFALEVVRPIVEEGHCGKLIYAGGDDVLALLPIEDLLPAMHDLHGLSTGQQLEVQVFGRSFSSDGSGFVRLTENSQERWLLLPGPKMSISAGAVIAHHTHPLWHVAEEVRLALKEAKEKHGREAWAVHILKRSGEPVHTGGKWCYESWKVVETIQEVVRFFERGLSPRFLYEMERIAEAMRALPKEAQEAELRRLLSRREGLTPQDHNELIELGIPAWLGKISGTSADPWGQVLSWLRLAHFLARGARG